MSVKALVPGDENRLVEHVSEIFDTAVKNAQCGPGSAPETGMQGGIPAADRATGRSTQGYSCNLTRVGRLYRTRRWDRLGKFRPLRVCGVAVPGEHRRVGHGCAGS